MRIVELEFLANQLESVCVHCSKPLIIIRTRSETVHGFGSILYIDCECGVLKVKKNFNVNTKAAFGMVGAGIGLTEVQLLLPFMNLPSPDDKILKKWETEVGKAIEHQAKLSCSSVLEVEIHKIESIRYVNMTIFMINCT